MKKIIFCLLFIAVLAAICRADDNYNYGANTFGVATTSAMQAYSTTSYYKNLPSFAIPAYINSPVKMPSQSLYPSDNSQMNLNSLGDSPYLFGYEQKDYITLDQLQSPKEQDTNLKTPDYSSSSMPNYQPLPDQSLYNQQYHDQGTK